MFINVLGAINSSCKNISDEARLLSYLEIYRNTCRDIEHLRIEPGVQILEKGAIAIDRENKKSDIHM